jgi:hypothetical protein
MELELELGTRRRMVMARKASTESSAAAYVPFDTFEGFLDRLKDVGVVPDHIGRESMSNISGGLQSHLLASLRFLKLIGPDGKTEQSLHDLVNARKTEAWAGALATVIQSAYASIVGDMNLKSGVLSKLRERFKEQTNFDGATLDKSVRFYLKALKSAEIEVSPHFFQRKKAVRRPSTNGRTSREPAADTPPPKSDSSGVTPPASGITPPPAGMIEHPIFFRGKPTGYIRVPADLTEQDCNVIELTLAVLKGYAAQGANAKTH